MPRLRWWRRQADRGRRSPVECEEVAGGAQDWQVARTGPSITFRK